MKKLLIFFGLLLAVLLVVLVIVPRAELYRLGAELSYAPAQVELGDLYYLGQGVRQDDAEAAKWFKLAANKGNAEAQYSLGLMYNDGSGVPRNLPEALKWYRLAAEQGHIRARNNVIWVLATAPDSKLRNGAEALRLAQQLIAESDIGTYAGHRDTLAAAYAAAGRFEDAVKEQQLAIKLLRAGYDHLLPGMESRLELYRRSQPYRE